MSRNIDEDNEPSSGQRVHSDNLTPSRDKYTRTSKSSNQTTRTSYHVNEDDEVSSGQRVHSDNLTPSPAENTRYPKSTREKDAEQGEWEELRQEGPHNVTTFFMMDISVSDWAEIKPRLDKKPKKDPRNQYILKPKDWTEIFSSTFLRYCKPEFLQGCILAFKTPKINMTEGKANTFLSTSARCTRDNGACKVKYKFVIDKKPSDNSAVRVRVA